MAASENPSKKTDERIKELEDKYTALAKQTEQITQRFLKLSQNATDIVTIMETQARLFRQVTKN